MSDYLINGETLTGLGSVVRSLSGDENFMTPDEMIVAISETESAIHMIEEHMANKSNPHGITASSIGALGVQGGIPANSDFNNYTENGSYYVTDGNATTVSNMPTNSFGFLTVINHSNTSTKRALQIFTRGHSSSTSFYIRKLYNTTWSEWYLLLHSGNIDTAMSSYATKEYVDSLFAESSNPPSQDISLTLNGSYNCYRDYWDSAVSITCSPSTTNEVYALAQISLKAGNSKSFGTLDFSVPCGGSYKAENIKVCDSDGYGGYFDMTFSFTGSKLSVSCVLKSKVTSNGSAYFGHITGTGRYIGKYV